MIDDLPRVMAEEIEHSIYLSPSYEYPYYDLVCERRRLVGTSTYLSRCERECSWENHGITWDERDLSCVSNFVDTFFLVSCDVGFGWTFIIGV